MTDIVKLDEHRPHISGPVACTRCRHEWTAVRPVGADLLECPACGAIRGVSLDTMLHKPHLILGAECCGQRDSDGVCAAPACLYGDALMLIQCIRDASHLEYAALRTENEKLRAYALKAFTVVEFCSGQGLLLPHPTYDCDDLLMEGVELLNVETSEEARAALEEK